MKRETSEYRAYRNAKDRCTNPNSKAWKNYGGRGIEFHFTSFEEFLRELGTRPKGLILDRKDNDGHYEKGNVRWATWSESNRNRRLTVGQSIREAHKRPEVKTLHLRRTRDGHRTEKARKNHAEATRLFWSNPNRKRKRRAAFRKAWKLRKLRGETPWNKGRRFV